MFASILFRPALMKLAVAVIMSAHMLGWITYARANGVEASSSLPPEMTPPNSLPAVRQALREFDRFLDHHPLLEDQLRLDAKLTANHAFLRKNPDLHAFLRANPSVLEGLRVYPRYFLNRALLRQACAPLSFAELGPFKELFQQHPKLEKELAEKPELVCDPEFLKSHAALRDCLAQHPALSQVYLHRSVALGSK